MNLHTLIPKSMNITVKINQLRILTKMNSNICYVIHVNSPGVTDEATGKGDWRLGCPVTAPGGHRVCYLFVSHDPVQ